MESKETRKAWLDSSQVVLDVLHAWGKQPYIGDLSANTYSKFNVLGLTNALEDTIKRGREALRPKFDRLAASDNSVWDSSDFPGMYRATASDGRLMGPYLTREHALDALEAIFNAEATR